MTQHLYGWQRKYATSLRIALRRGTVALVQLPTGAGKTAVVLAALARMRPLPGRIIVAMPRRHKVGTTPWERDLELAGFKRGTTPDDINLEIRSHHDLARYGDCQLLRYRQGQRHSRGFHSDIGSDTVIVLDEVHRAKRLLKELERYRPFGRRKGIKLILVSATPVNPVRIQDSHAQAELSERRLELLEDHSIKTGYLRLYRALAQVARGDLGDVRDLGAARSLEQVADCLRKIEDQLRPIPRISEMKRHRAPEQVPNLPMALAESRNGGVDGAVEKLVGFMSQIGPRREGLGKATAERFAIAACLPESVRIKKMGWRPIEFTAQARHNRFSGRYAADSLLGEASVASHVAKMDYKLLALEKFLRGHFEKGPGAGRVLVFCRFRRTVWWLSAWLESRRRYWAGPCLTAAGWNGHAPKISALYHDGAKRVVWDTETYSNRGRDAGRSDTANDARLVGLFNDAVTRPSGLVLVTSDRLSESVDLHRDCGTLIHFDMDWSPLRMMQRVGRLWRHAGFLELSFPRSRSVVPPFPRVFHMRYPCSVDDEIYNRLQRRWKRLQALGLGLDFIPFVSCLGQELGEWQRRIGDLINQEKQHERA